VELLFVLLLLMSASAAAYNIYFLELRRRGEIKKTNNKMENNRKTSTLSEQVQNQIEKS